MRDFEQSIIINEKIKLEERFEFRTIFSEEAVQAASVERVCFPPNEACTEEMMKRRALKIRELFFVAVDRKSGEVAGFLNGLATDGDCLKDEFFRNADLHDPTGDNVMILGLAVLPKYRGIGVASELMRRSSGIQRQQGRCALILTCLDAKVEMYKKMGFEDEGISDSSWGGEQWHQMRKGL